MFAVGGGQDAAARPHAAQQSGQACWRAQAPALVSAAAEAQLCIKTASVLSLELWSAHQQLHTHSLW